jgi:hypothetical protein
MPFVTRLFNYGNSYRDRFHWHLFEAYNAMAASRFADELGALILHADKLTYHRPDGHVQVGTRMQTYTHVHW